MDIMQYREVFDKDAGYYNGYFSNTEITDIDEKMIASGAKLAIIIRRIANITAPMKRTGLSKVLFDFSSSERNNLYIRIFLLSCNTHKNIF